MFINTVQNASVLPSGFLNVVIQTSEKLALVSDLSQEKAYFRVRDEGGIILIRKF